jgi:hypothetical protein
MSGLPLRACKRAPLSSVVRRSLRTSFDRLGARCPGSCFAQAKQKPAPGRARAPGLRPEQERRGPGLGRSHSERKGEAWRSASEQLETLGDRGRCSPPNECRSACRRPATPSRTRVLGGTRACCRGAAPLAPQPAAALCLRCDVLVHVEKVARIVGAFDLHQPLVVLAVVVSNPAVVVILHEVDVAARLRIWRQGLVVIA